MAFRATNSVPQEAYRLVKGAATQLRVNCAGFISTLAASGADYQYLKGIVRTLQRADNQFNTLKTTPGLADYAAAQENDTAYDVVAEFTTMQGAITSVLSWMDANVPTSVTVASPSAWTDNDIITTAFTPAQTAGLRTQLQGVVDAIS